MNTQRKIELIKYHIKLIKELVRNNNQPLYKFALKNGFEEKQINALLNILCIFQARIKKEEISPFNKNNDLFRAYHISLESLYNTSQPNINEFRDYIEGVFYQDLELYDLLYAVRKQDIYPLVCDYLLKDSVDKIDMNTVS
ncbi:DUF1878 domain-containing protein [Bacillus cereus group sp. N34]|uniref:DUF1878 domain-containing protein n=1 Tax=Bacillus cereus group sp. N34 TaxID=2794595 RepID=UPI0018F2887F|nr:DUF1878 domain-containing protein [Bacillus cereus group sp. N34]MBJ8015090.1 DUF1878 domain-containing protein [Bacillus cereus group sp. N34]